MPQTADRPGGVARSGNPNPHQARQAKRRRRRKPGTVADLKKHLWAAIDKLSESLEGDAVEVSDLTRLTHALSQAATSYLKVVEVGDLEARLTALEQSLEKQP